MDPQSVLHDLPLRRPTPRAWAELAAAHLDEFLADHAVCEQQAALTALHLVGRYPDDDALVRRLTALAAEEVSHLRRVCQLLHRRGLRPAGRRPNPWVQALLEHVAPREPERKVDRLLVCALIEARSCERFTRLLGVIEDRDEAVARLLCDLGPAERRHWELFYGLASRELPRPAFEARWRRWLEIEDRSSAQGGRSPRVHG